ncbi:SGNH/GDSL hydrolase family protein [Pseudaestuariivita sp.]|uniref:SGNH/GDSL hydrolase family protein n=1 Tax=Pseudaestuariivita sp. TaxID=2211669 RepID=UPI0040582870
MRTILTFGDSNTHGTMPLPADGSPGGRHGLTERWPRVMLEALGEGWHLVEEGLPGRTTCRSDPGSLVEMDGGTGLMIALKSHAPVDVLTIMLGTNDTKTRFAATPMQIMGGIAGLLDLVVLPDVQEAHPGLKVLVICPPPVQERGVLADMFMGAEGVSAKLADLCATLCTARDVRFLDAGSLISVSPVDGVHFDAEAHAVLGRAVARTVRSLV